MPVMGYSGRLDPLVGCAGEQLASSPLNSGGAMGSRSRSIRLRIYFLVAIPLVALVGLIGYGVTTAVTNAISLDRAPNLVNATAVPAVNFGNYLQAERTVAVVYLFQPTAASLQAYQAAIAATDKAKPAFMAAMTSEATVGTETASGAKTINGIVCGLSKLPDLRNAVKARLLNPLDALGFYSQGMGDEVKLFLTQTESVVANDQQSQAVGLIATVQAREQLSEGMHCSPECWPGRGCRRKITSRS